MNKIFSRILLVSALCGTNLATAQNEVSYVGDRIVNIDYTHGAIPYYMGVHNIQTMRANRERPDLADGFGWTYNHAANLAYWNDTFFLHYLSDPEGEHIPSSQTLIQTSRDGYRWDKPAVIFPPYRVPDGYTKEGFSEVAKDLDAIMHQRMGFYVTKNGEKLLALGYYGICMNHKDKPLDGNGIGRVVREIHRDGTFGPIYFIRYNHEWNEKNTIYPFYTSSKDKAFIAACNELLADPLMMQQWVEEADRDDPLIPILNPNLKGFNYYTLKDGRKVALWKVGLYAISSDGGKTWTQPAKVNNLVTGSAKSWGQNLSDGNYAMVYNPSYFRWPMVMLTSSDGLNFSDMQTVHGEVSPMRYSGFEKSFGPQYLRGIMPGNGVVPDGHMWLGYSVNKEDMWVMRVSMPLSDFQSLKEHFSYDFSTVSELAELTDWNIYSPLWSPVEIAKLENGISTLRLSDRDPYDYAKAEHYFPEGKKVGVDFTVVPHQNDTGLLCIELQTKESYAATRVDFDSDGMIRVKRGAKYTNILPYVPGESYDIRIEADCMDQRVSVTVNGKTVATNFYAPVHTLSKVVFRTGETFKDLHVDLGAYDEFILPDGGIPVANASFSLLRINSHE